VLAIWFLLLVVSTGIALGGGLRINLSGSMPAGCYRLTATKIERGALVAACPYLTFRRATGAGTGLSGPRSWLPRALGYMREGDALIVWKLDRLARSLKQLIETVEANAARGVGFQSLTEELNTTTAGGKLTFHIFVALAKFERGMIHERMRVGLMAARARGKVGGRPRSLDETGLQSSPRKAHPVKM